jgi:hypothetical protein
MIVSVDLGLVDASSGPVMGLMQASNTLHHKAAVGRCCQTVAYERVHYWARGRLSRFGPNPS